MTLRVVEWSTGTVGRHAIVGIDAHPDLELVGVWVSDPAKVGKDAGRLAGLDRDLGIIATNDRQALLDLKPDAIVHTAMTDDRIFEAIADLTAFVRAGINVVSSGPVLLQYPFGVVPDSVTEPIVEAAKAGGVSLHVNGIDPGFANDVLPLAMTSLSRRIDEVRCAEIADYSTYYQPVVNSQIFGFGQPMDQTPMLLNPGVLSMAWGAVVRQIAAGLGVTLDEPLVERIEQVAADRDYDTVSGKIPKGTRGRCTFRWSDRSTASIASCSSTTPATTPTSAPTGPSRPPATAATASTSPAIRYSTSSSATTASTATTMSPAWSSRPCVW